MIEAIGAFIVRYRIAVSLAIMIVAAAAFAQYLEANHSPVSEHDAFIAGCELDGLHPIVCASYWWQRAR